MRKNYRHPVAGIVLMVLVCAVIAALLVTTGYIVPLGRVIVFIVLAGFLTASLSMLVLLALRRAGIHRFAELRTWPQN